MDDRDELWGYTKILLTAMYTDVEMPKVEGESKMEGTRACKLGTVRKGRRDQDLHEVRRGYWQLGYKDCLETTQLYKQNPEDNVEPYETKRPQPS